MFKVGKVSHYYDKIGVAVVELEGTLSVGEKIKFFSDGREMFEQIVESIQVEHQKLDSANRGDTVGLKTIEKVSAGMEIFKA